MGAKIDSKPEVTTPTGNEKIPLSPDGFIKISNLPAGSGGGGAVDSVNGQVGVVVLDNTDVGADASGAAAAAQAASQPLDSDLTAIAALSTTSFGRALLVLADATAGRTALALGTAATQASGAFDSAGAAAAAQAASQPVDSDLTAIAALTTTTYGRSFLALADAASARSALALGTAATSNTGDFDAAGAAAAAQAASQPVDSDLTAIAALTTTTYGRAFLALANAAAALTALGLDADLATLALPASTTISAFGASLIDDAAASNARTTLGLGTAATSNTGDFDAAGAAASAQAASQPLDSDLTAIAALTTTSFGRSLLAAADASALRTLAATVIGTNVQAWDADLDTLAANITAFGQSLVDDANAATARTTLGLGTAATTAATDYQPIDSDLTAIAALTTTSFGRAVLALADAAALRTAAGLGTIATQNANNVTISGGSVTGITDLTVADGGTGLSTLTAHAVQVGAGTSTPVQVGPDISTTKPLFAAGSSADPAFRAIAVADLPTGTGASNVPIGGVITGAGPQGDASHTQVLTFNNAGQLTAVTNTAIAVAESAVTNLTTDLAAKAPLASPTFTGTVTIPTGASITAPTGLVKGDVGLGNVDNTSDATKNAASVALTNKTLTSPVLNTGVSGTAVDTDATMAANSDTLLASQKATKTALALKAALASPALTGTPTAPTASPGTNTTQVATTAYADAIAALKQPLDSDLTTIAGLTATTDNFLVAVASAWASRTPAQVKSTLAIAESDVTNLVTDLAALQTQTTVQAAQIVAHQAANSGYFVNSGGAYSANASALTSVSTTVSTSLLNKTAHGLVANDTILLSGLTGATTGISNGVVYFVSATGLVANSFRVAATSGGTAITFGGSNESTVITVTQVGKLDQAAAVLFVPTTELNIAAQTAIATTVASMADATNPKWVWVEQTAAGATAFNQGTAAASPAIPALTAARIPMALIPIPANATQIDTLFTTNNGNAKLIDMRELMLIHPSRVLARDIAATTITANTTWPTNGTTSTSILASAPSIPANSLNVGDVLLVTASGLYINNVSASVLNVAVGITGALAFSAGTESLNTSASTRRWSLSLTINITAIGSGTSANGSVEGTFLVSAPGAGAPALLGVGGAASGSGLVQGANHTGGWDSTAAQTFDLKFFLGTASGTTPTMSLRNFTIVKIPV